MNETTEMAQGNLEQNEKRPDNNQNRRPNNNRNRNPKSNPNTNPNTAAPARNSNPNANTNTNPNTTNNNNAGNNKNRRRNAPAPIDTVLKEFVTKNQEIHKQRLNPHYKLNLNSMEKVRITPLGGLGEIGGNITVFETEKEAIIIDVGMSFPDEDMHGVDILVPDFTYLREIKNKIVAVIITHAHEDHIGAMPYLYKEMQFPIYGTPLPLAMIGNKFDEHHLKEFRKYFNPIEKRKPYKIGNDFEIEWMHMTHSIID